MAHVRKQIRDAVATEVTGLTTTGTNVFKTRAYPVGPGKLPGLAIYTTSEDSAVDSMGSARGLMRELDLIIEGYANGTNTVDDDLDAIATEVEEALAAATIDEVKDLYLVRTEMDVDGGEGDKVVGAVRLTFRAVYRTTPGDVQTAI